MKKILLGILILFQTSVMGQETQVSLTHSTDNTSFVELLIRNSESSVPHFVGVGFEVEENNGGDSLYCIGGIQVLNRLQLQVNLGYEVKSSIPNNTVFYYANKIVLKTNNDILLGFGFDNQNRGLFTLGFEFD
jgi:hypothetical protein